MKSRYLSHDCICALNMQFKFCFLCQVKRIIMIFQRQLWWTLNGRSNKWNMRKFAIWRAWYLVEVVTFDFWGWNLDHSGLWNEWIVLFSWRMLIVKQAGTWERGEGRVKDWKVDWRKIFSRLEPHLCLWAYEYQWWRDRKMEDTRKVVA